MSPSGYAAKMVKSYLARLNTYKHDKNCRGDIERDNVYARWATIEIFRAIRNNPEVPPLQIIDDFITSWTISAVNVSGPNSKRLFAVAADTAVDIYDELVKG